MPYRSQHPCCKCNSSIVSDKVTISCLVLSNKFTHQHKYLQDNAGLILLIVSSWFAVKLFLYFFQLIVAYVAMFFCSFLVFFSSLVHNLLVREPSVIPRPTMYKFFVAKAKKEKWKKKNHHHKIHESGSLVPRPPPLIRIKQHKYALGGLWRMLFRVNC